MPIDITIPNVGESVTEVTIAAAHKASGEWVERDDPIFDLETDKATMPVLAPAAGIVTLKVAVGDTLKIGASVGAVDDKAPKPQGAKPPTAAASSGKAAEAKTAAKAGSSAAPALGAPAAGRPGATATISPTRERSPSANGHAAPGTPDGAADGTGGGAPGGPSAGRATPLAEKLAEELGIDISRVVGTGAGHRIREQDVLAAAHARTVVPSTPGAAPGASSPASTIGSPGAAAPGSAASSTRTSTRERMSALRQRIASRLVEAQHTAAMLTTFNEVDMTAVMDMRKRYKEQFEKSHGIGLGFMSFFVRAAASALRAFPMVNAYIVEENAKPAVEKHDYADIAVAVSTPRGLVVPVLRDAQTLSFAQIESGIKDFATRAQAGTLEIHEMQGGTFTITNGGVFGSLMSTPILNPPQSAILGMHAIKNRAVEDPASPGQVALRPMMYLALSYDHRIVDGSEAVRFLVHVKECIERPERMLIGL